jgi:hypothetical protein
MLPPAVSASLGETGTDLRLKKIKQERAGNREPDSATHKIASENVEQVSRDLARHDHDGQSPSPTASSKPADSCHRQGRGQQQKQNSNPATQRGKLLVSRRIESPDSVESRARHSNVAAARLAMSALQNRNRTIAVKPSGFRPLRSSAGGLLGDALLFQHLLNLSQRNHLSIGFEVHCR